MKALIEIPLFLGLAVAVHLVLLVRLPEGAESAGDAGTALVSINAADAGLAARVAAWERSPQVAPAPEDPARISERSMPPPPLEAQTAAARPGPAEMLTRPDGAEAALPAPPPIAAAPGAPVLPDAPVSEDETSLAMMPSALDAPATRDVASDRLPKPETRLQPEVYAAPPEPLAARHDPDHSPRPLPRPDAAQATSQEVPREPPPSSAAPQRAGAEHARPAQQAAGSGDQGAQGRSGAANAGLSATARQSLLAEWGGRIRAQIERRKPGAAGRGVVMLDLTVNGDGSLRAVALAGGSGNSILDQIALRAVQGAGAFPRAPEGLGSGPHRFRLPMRFE